MRRPRDFRVLDKDLGSITHQEIAQMQAIRPVVRLGAAILMLVALTLLVMGVSGTRPGLVTIGTGLMIAGWMGFAIGSNDVANSLGAAYGAGAIRLVPGLILVALAEVMGAIIAGGPVTERLADGLFDTAQSVISGHAQVVMLAALIAAAAWITTASTAGLPVSASHSIVGAIAGAGLVVFGVEGINWPALGAIALAWVLTPMAAAALAGAILIFIEIKVRDAPDRHAAARRWVNLLVGLMIALGVAYIFDLITPGRPVWMAGLAGLLAGGLAAWFTGHRMAAMLQDLDDRPGMTMILRPALLFAVAIMAFAHGAGDAGNIAGPLLVILRAEGQVGANGVPVPLLLMAGVSIAAGSVLFGRRLVTMVGSGITRLNAMRALCITLATAMIVLFSSGLGLPVSSTHVAVGGVFGVGFAREWLDRRRNRSRKQMPAEEIRRRALIRRSHVLSISVAWMVTVPLTASLAAGCAWLLLILSGL